MAEFINDPSIIKEFVAEFQEHVQKLELNIISLEKDPGNLAILNEIFRPIHTLKGSAGFLGFTNITEFSHKLESLLDQMRKGKRPVTCEVVDLLLASLDIIKNLIEDVSHGGNGSGIDVTEVVAMVEAVASKPGEIAPAVTARPKPDIARDAVGDRDAFIIAALQHYMAIGTCLEEIEKNVDSQTTVDSLFRSIHSLKASTSYMGFQNISRLTESAETVLDAIRKNDIGFTPQVVRIFLDYHQKIREMIDKVKKSGDPDEGMGEITEKFEALRKEALANVEQRGAKTGAKPKQDLTEHSIRVSMQKLDALMNLVGQLIINKSRFDMLEKKLQNEYNLPEVYRELKDATLAVDRVTDDLHNAVMEARMITIGTVFNRFPRMVRELARKKNKQIELVISGEDTEIDKTVVEEISDPLVHIIRNSADHGVETTEQRLAEHKPANGTISLRAYHESGSVVIEIEDDGHGIDTKRVKDKAIRNGLITPEQAEVMSEQEAINLVFMPGFSTAEVVTDVSGRGVGMDVVKTNIEKLRGKIHVQTELGKGTKITLKLPLTMAIIETLMVKVAGDTYAIPLLSVNTIAEIHASQINLVQGNEAVILHGRTIGLVRMGELLKVSEKSDNDRVPVVVIEAKIGNGERDSEIGLIVDSIQDKQKIVIRPLDDSFMETFGFSGVTILGDGKAALIIDPVETIEMATRSRYTRKKATA